MVSDEQYWSIVGGGLDMIEAIDVHDVVGGYVDPASTENTLTPGPETLPTAVVHTSRQVERELLETR